MVPLELVARGVLLELSVNKPCLVTLLELVLPLYGRVEATFS